MKSVTLPEDDDLCRMPEICRGTAEAAVNAGLARYPEEYWRSNFGPTHPGRDEGPAALEVLVAGIIKAHPSQPEDRRTEQIRYNQAISALLGTSYRDGENDKDDREMLADIAWMADCDVDGDPKRLREFARQALVNFRGAHAVTEASVRRLVSKYKADRAAAMRFATAPDHLRLSLQRTVLEEIATLLKAVGTKVDLPDPGLSHLSMEK